MNRFSLFFFLLISGTGFSQKIVDGSMSANLVTPITFNDFESSVFTPGFTSSMKFFYKERKGVSLEFKVIPLKKFTGDYYILSDTSSYQLIDKYVYTTTIFSIGVSYIKYFGVLSDYLSGGSYFKIGVNATYNYCRYSVPEYDKTYFYTENNYWGKGNEHILGYGINFAFGFDFFRFQSSRFYAETAFYTNDSFVQRTRFKKFGLFVLEFSLGFRHVL